MKRITNIFFLLLFVLNTLIAQNHLPTFKYLTVSPKTIKNDESLEITINAYDSIYGIRNMGVSIYNPVNKFIDQVLIGSNEYIGNNIYKASYQISRWAISGLYKVADLVIINNVDNILYNLTKLDSFTVVSSSPDTTSPSIKSVKLYPDTLNILDTLKCEFEASDEVSGLYVLWFDLYDARNEQVDYDIRYFNGIDILSLGNGKYLVKKIIPSGAIKGNWHVNMGIYDYADNYVFYADTNKFFINGIYFDITPPIIKSVIAFPDTIYTQDTLKIMIRAEDVESGLKKLNLYLIHEQNYWDPFYFYFNSNIWVIGQNEFLLLVDRRLSQKENLGFRFDLYDNEENYISYTYPSKIFITGQLDSTRVGIKNIPCQSNLIELFPNPFNDIINIKINEDSFEKGLLRIYNIIGYLMYEKEIYSEFSVDLSTFSKGIYCFIVTDNKNKISVLVNKR